MINNLISNSKKKKKNPKTIFLEIWLQSSQHKHNSDGINPTLISPNQKKTLLYWRVGIYSDNKERIKFHEWERENDIPNWVGASSKWLIVSQIIKGIKPSELSGGIQDLLLELEFGIILWFIIIKLIDWKININIYICIDDNK